MLSNELGDLNFKGHNELNFNRIGAGVSYYIVLIFQNKAAVVSVKGLTVFLAMGTFWVFPSLNSFTSQ